MIELDKLDIQNLFNLSVGAEAVRMAYIAQSEGRVLSPPVTWLDFQPVNGECHVKSGYIAGTEGFVVKIATGFYDNPRRGLVTSNGINLVFSAQTGQPLAFLKDAGWLTDVRTGLSGAVATHALARAGYCDVLIVGAGIQCLHQARCLQRLAAARHLRFHIWGRDGEKAKGAAKVLRDGGLNAEPTADLQSAVAQADAIVTITPAKSPLIRADWVSPGTHITAIGADCPGKQELDTDLVARADLLVCDLTAQSLFEGEFQTAFASGHITEDNVVALGDVLSGVHSGRPNDQAITIADLTGLAALDAAAALTVLKAARQTSVSKEKP